MKSWEEKAEDTGLVFYFEGLDSIDGGTAGRWLAELPPFRQEKALRYRFPKDRLRSTAAFCLLSAALGFVPAHFSLDENGKPALEGGPHFSISHAANCVAAAVDGAPVGVDAETVGKAPFEVMERVFTPEERRQIENAQDPNRAFYRFWTLKESFIKMTGEGMNFPLLELTITDGAPVRCSLPGCALQAYGTAQSQLSVCGQGAFEFVAVSFEQLAGRWQALNH